MNFEELRKSAAAASSLGYNYPHSSANTSTTPAFSSEINRGSSNTSLFSSSDFNRAATGANYGQAASSAYTPGTSATLNPNRHDHGEPSCSSNTTPGFLSSIRSSSLTTTPGGMGRFKTPTTSAICRSAISSSTPLTGSARFKTPNTGSARRTPGSRRAPFSATSTESPSAIVAIVEGRGMARGEIGMACIDLKRPVLKLSQFSDNHTYVRTMTKMQILQPMEIIIPNTVGETANMSKFSAVLNDHFNSLNLVTVQRKYFNETKGLQYVKQLCVSDFNTVEMEVRTKFYCLSAAAALLKYIEYMQNIYYAPGSLKVIFRGGEETTMIDMSTSIHLELMQNNRDSRSEHSLFGILNSTKTPMGCRLLRSNILQPSNSVDTITMRFDAVQELTEKSEIFYSLQSIFSRVIDVDNLLSFCVQIPKEETIKIAEQKITNMICLKHVLELVQPLKRAIEDATSPLITAYYESLGDERFEVILEKINKVFHEDTKYQKGIFHLRTQKCFAVRPGINGLLDVSRKVYTELVDEVSENVQNLAEVNELPLKTSYNSNRGFHVQLYCGGKNNKYDQNNLPEVFIKVSKFKATLSFTTMALIKLNERIKLALQEIYLMTNLVVSDLMGEIREHMGCLYKLTECISMLDMLVAFAHNCTLGQYVRPDLTDTLAIKQGLHPILERIKFETPIANNVYSSEESNVAIITGPNMSGKSTYLRQIALLQIMVQIGSFVPAEFASFKVADQIFSRIGSDDDIETNSSTFMLEMKEINYIIQNATKNSLIVIDELGRGTNVDEGVGICHAICEMLIKSKAHIFFATHFLEVTNLGNLYPNVQNYHFEVQQVTMKDGENSHVKTHYNHVLSKGTTKDVNYGIQLAEMSTLAREITERAKVISAQLSQPSPMPSGEEQEIIKKKANFKLAKRLAQVAANSKLDDDSLSHYLMRLKEQYQRDMASAADVQVED